jgi:LysR family glycine cleavage system transcriptional activator
MGREVVVIGAPDALARLQTPNNVRSFTLLHHAAEPAGWARFCVQHDVADIEAMAGPRLDQVSSLVQAVIAGLGLALVPRCLVEDELSSGAVVAAPFPVFEQKHGYYLCYPETKARLPAVQAFRAWALAQAHA